MSQQETSQPRRPITLREFVARFQSKCVGRNDQETEMLWTRDACPELANAAEALGFTAEEVRACTFMMLQESSRRLVAARQATDALAHHLEPGILSIVVVGSAARGEAIQASDIDFNVYVTPEYIESLHSSRDAKAKNRTQLLRNWESRLRERIHDELREALHNAGYDPGDRLLTMKPFTEAQLVVDDDPKLALLHLLNLLFGATPVYRIRSFDDLLASLLFNRSLRQRQGALLGRIALLRCRGAALLGEPWVFETPTRATSEVEAYPLSAFHTVAVCISAVLASGIGDNDPQMPYWTVLDEAGAIVEPPVRRAIEMFLARVTLMRSGVASAAQDSVAKEALETALGLLPVAVDAIVDHLIGRGVGEDVISAWENLLGYLLYPGLAQGLARDLGLC